MNSIINEEDLYGMTPLHRAATKGDLREVLELLDKGADPYKFNAQKQLPLHRTLFVPMLYEEELLLNKAIIFQELLALTPEALTLQDNEGNTVLHLLATHCFVDIMTQVLSAYPELALVKNNAAHYPIHTAILNHQQAAIDLLLSIEGVSALPDRQNCLPLHYAVRFGTAAMVLACCKTTVNIDSLDSEGKTPLMWAAYSNNQEAVRLLIQNGADRTLIE